MNHRAGVRRERVKGADRHQTLQCGRDTPKATCPDKEEVISYSYETVSSPVLGVESSAAMVKKLIDCVKTAVCKPFRVPGRFHERTTEPYPGRTRGWRGVSVVKRAHCSSGGPGLDS